MMPSKVYTTNEMKAVLPISSINLIMVPPGCTSKSQPLDICINKLFKGVLQNRWEGQSLGRKAEQ